MRGDGRGKRAAGAVRVAAGDPFGVRNSMNAVAVVQQVDDVSRTGDVAALDDARADGAERDDPPRRLPAIRRRSRIVIPDERFRLGHVRRHDEGARAAAPTSSRRAPRRRAGGRRSWRSSPDRRRASGTSRSSTAAATASTMAAVASMPVLAACAPMSRHHRFDLRGHEIGRQRLERGHAERVLRRHRGDRARAVDAVRGERLEVGLDAGAAARIAAGNCQRRHAS